MNLVPNFQKTLIMLTPEQKEELMGFEIGHTEISNWDKHFSKENKYIEARHAALGNSFQCDTVAYLLSPLKNKGEGFENKGQGFGSPLECWEEGEQNIYNRQIKKLNVLSLFDGIGGAAVALKKLDIKVRKYYSSETNPFAKFISRRFVETKLGCEFVDLGDVKNVNYSELLDQFVGDEKIGLVVGGPPCWWTGIVEEKSKLFFDYAQILHHLRNLYNKTQ
eukprot:TRINITY_DN2057_c0_g6_i2.p1 TRINITY_DN2057_c0_g6~~TRINITY_DN2057_c0_g6_i2.p1  ORF type:complete len:221 (+),score=49.66 TRINITY_DN2057_c0_g6_i2:952-1614(+)